MLILKLRARFLILTRVTNSAFLSQRNARCDAASGVVACGLKICWEIPARVKWAWFRCGKECDIIRRDVMLDQKQVPALQARVR